MSALWWECDQQGKAIRAARVQVGTPGAAAGASQEGSSAALPRIGQSSHIFFLMQAE